MPKSMPAPCAKEAPQFKGEYLKDFLDEFEILAKAAGISDAECCDYLARYCCRDKSGFDHKRFVKGLKEYLVQVTVSFHCSMNQMRVLGVSNMLSGGLGLSIV
jgi:hypothetical protein